MSIRIRSLVKFGHLKCSSYRGLKTSSVTMEKAMEKLQENPYYEKYAARIAELQKTSPEEFTERVESARRQADAERKAKFAPPPSAPDTRQYSSVLNPKQPCEQIAPVEEKKLDKIFKTDLVKDKDASEIKEIWEKYHMEKEVISATIPLELYEVIRDSTQKYPMFLFPLPRSQGYEFIMSQADGHTVHFTPLLAYQVHKENAPECLTMVHYTELKDKGIVLMRGEYDKNVLNGKEAQCLANQFQMYYNNKDSTKSQLLRAFAESPDAFKHMDLITELENISLL